VTALSEHLDRYIAVRRALGYQLEETSRLLVDFVGHLEAHDQHTITVESALAWASGAASDGRMARRLSIVRGFARYVQAFDDATEVPPTSLGPGRHGRRTPYLYSPEEITALMAAARQLSPQLWATSVATLIGLVASTGIRTGEGYRLDRAHVDLEAGQLSLMDSKFGRSRRIPLHITTIDALGRYARLRDGLVDPAEQAFFVTGTGRRLTRNHLSGTFRGLLAAACIFAPAGRRPPRLSDLRHGFAVNTLLDWHRDSVDVQRQLPVLSAYLGHLRPSNTYWYLEAAPELLAVVANRLEKSWQRQP
jgi:integrase/recombinase XerD